MLIQSSRKTVASSQTPMSSKTASPSTPVINFKFPPKDDTISASFNQHYNQLSPFPSTHGSSKLAFSNREKYEVILTPRVVAKLIISPHHPEPDDLLHDPYDGSFYKENLDESTKGQKLVREIKSLPATGYTSVKTSRIHNPERMPPSFYIQPPKVSSWTSARGYANLGTILLTLVFLIGLFMVYPVVEQVESLQNSLPLPFNPSTPASSDNTLNQNSTTSNSTTTS
jgi:hypothetical protein